jgi:hypothetical protein
VSAPLQPGQETRQDEGPAVFLGIRAMLAGQHALTAQVLAKLCGFMLLHFEGAMLTVSCC